MQVMTSSPEARFKPTEVRTRKGRALTVRACSSEDFATLVEMYASFEPKRVAHTILCPIRQTEVEFTIFVLQDHREENLGTVMSQLTMAWALEMGFSKVFLTTQFSNYRAIGLFRKLGFHTTSSYGDECEMVIDLLANSKAQAA